MTRYFLYLFEVFLKKLLLTLKAIILFLPVQFIIKKFLIIYLFIILFIDFNNSYSNAKGIKDYGIISIMYHRFEENKYPSTNIKIEDFKKHLDIIKNSNFNFISHIDFLTAINSKNNEKKILLTIDDGFSSFYENAWPILKKRKYHL